MPCSVTSNQSLPLADKFHFQGEALLRKIVSVILRSCEDGFPVCKDSITTQDSVGSKVIF